MRVIAVGLGVLLAVVAGLFVWSQIITSRLEAAFPPAGTIVELDGRPFHFIDMPAGENADLAPMIFIHGASGNARDLHGAFAEPLKGRARMVFIDRPGAGYSARVGDDDREPEAQAKRIAALMEHLAIDKAVIVGHSLGGAMTAAFALEFPQKTAGLVFLAPVSHPWPGGGVSWIYDVTNTPLVGWLFANTLAATAGSNRYRSSVREVFAPSPVPSDYQQQSATRLVLRPQNFIANAADVGAVYEATKRMSPRYGEIKAPTVIISGDSDSVVLAHVHSDGLKRDIPGAKLVWLKNTGHMPGYSGTNAVIAEIEALNATIAASR